MWISHQGETVSSLVVLAATKQWASYGNTRRRQVLITDPAVTMCCAMERTYSQSISSFVGLLVLTCAHPLIRSVADRSPPYSKSNHASPRYAEQEGEHD